MQRANLIHKHIKHVNAKLAECGAEVEGMLTPTLAQVTRFISTNFHRIAVNRKASLNCSVSWFFTTWLSTQPIPAGIGAEMWAHEEFGNGNYKDGVWWSQN